MSIEFFELAIPLTFVSFAQLFRSLCNASHFAQSHLLPSAMLALSTVKFGCQHQVIARTQSSNPLCVMHVFFLTCLSSWCLWHKGLIIHLNTNLGCPLLSMSVSPKRRVCSLPSM
ncbi:hypothetical protein GW17_00023983 [Ensete ventricosum]|nr:hypothetical protein GW17_00023983 [Ensete ventricosum]